MFSSKFNMTQNYNDIFTFVTEVSEKICKKNISNAIIQKINSGPHLICFHIRIPGKTMYIYMGRGKGIEGLWFHSTQIPAWVRVRDKFLEHLRAHLVGARLNEIIVDEQDRIVIFKYTLRGNNGIYQFFWSGRKFYFLNCEYNGNETNLFCSWKGNVEDKRIDIKELSSLFDEVGRKDLVNKKRDNLSIISNIDDYYNELENELKKLNSNNSKVKKIKVKIKKINDDLVKLKKWEDYKVKITNPLIPDDEFFSILSSLKIKKKDTDNRYKQLSLFFDRFKRIQASIAVQNERLELALEDLKKIEKKESMAPIGILPVVSPQWFEGKVAKNKKVDSSKEYEILEFNNWKMAIGLNAHGNDQIRNSWGKKDDYWIHLSGYPSAHAIIKLNHQSAVIEQEMIQTAASAIRDYSKLELEQVPIVYTKLKNVKSIKSKAGLVTYTKEKYLTVEFNKNWKATISAL